MSGRLPFDPARTRAAQAASDGGAGPSDGSAERPLALGELAGRIRTAIDRIGGPVWVEGEVTGLARREHWWFSLKDRPAAPATAAALGRRGANDVLVDAVIWRSRAAALDASAREAMQDGARVVVRGRLDWYVPGGRLRLVVDQVRPAGIGDLHARFERLRAKLLTEGLFASDHKRPLPVFPRRVAVVTSGEGAALQDVRATAAARFPATRIVLVDVRVQGERAAGEIVRALRGLDALARAGDPRAVDAIVLTRGGGSLEDLWAFNEESVVRAVHAIGVPLVAAIGHETDTLLAELAADERASTPTQAVMRLLPDRGELGQQLDAEARRLERLVRSRLHARRDRLGLLASRPCLQRPTEALRAPRERLARRAGELVGAVRARLADERHRLDRAARQLGRITPAGLLGERRRRLAAAGRRLDGLVRSRLPRPEGLDALARRLDGGCRRRLVERRRDVDRMAAALDLVDPERIVRRGFTWTTDADGAVLRTAAAARRAGELVTRFPDGEVRSRVEAAASGPSGPREQSPPKPRSRRGRRSDESSGPPSLFDDAG